jgi:hypothetical protein
MRVLEANLEGGFHRSINNQVITSSILKGFLTKFNEYSSRLIVGIKHINYYEMVWIAFNCSYSSNFYCDILSSISAGNIFILFTTHIFYSTCRTFLDFTEVNHIRTYVPTVDYLHQEIIVLDVVQGFKVIL